MYASLRTITALLLALAPFSSPSSAKPNVILIVTDDQGYGDMACHGNPWLKTPNLDRLHASSIRLTDYHVDPVCTPTRAALLTGRYSSRVGAWAVTQGRQLLNPDEVTMAEIFAASGYRTGMFGKWHLGDNWPYAPRFRGFQQTVRHLAGGVNEISNPIGNDYFDDTYFRNGQPEKFTGYCTDVFMREAMQFIRHNSSNPEQPFFVYLPLNAMHSPHIVAEKYSASFIAQGHPQTRANFYGMIANFDENLGHLLDLLQTSNLAQDTILIFMGDNGTAAGASRPNEKASGKTPGFNAGMRAQKGSVYDGGHRVACFVRWPAKFSAGRDIRQLTCHRDWLPTLIELCGLTTPQKIAFDGQSIAPLLQADTDTWPDRTLFIERQADQPQLQLQPTRKSPYPQYAVLTQQWRLVNGQLYDIKSDPAQQNNIAAAHPEVVVQLAEQYRQHYADVYSHNAAYTRFPLGAPQENPTLLTVRDWHPTSGNVIWLPDQLSDDRLAINGFWAVDVTRPGRYEICLTRHPDDAPAPMHAQQAQLKIGTHHQTQALNSTDTSATFTLDLQPGPTLLQTWLTAANNSTPRGAYFVKVTRQED